MVLGTHVPGRVGRRRFFLRAASGRLVVVPGCARFFLRAASGRLVVVPGCARPDSRGRAFPRPGRTVGSAGGPGGPIVGTPLALPGAGRNPIARAPRAGRLARPPRPGAGGRGSGAARREGKDRRDADLSARADHPWPARALVMTELPAMRVSGDGGGVAVAPLGRRARCLTQGRELDGRANGLTHQLAERALLRAAGHRGEHVFGNLGVGSDGTTRGLAPETTHFARIWLWNVRSGRHEMNAILQHAHSGPRASGARRAAGTWRVPEDPNCGEAAAARRAP